MHVEPANIPSLPWWLRPLMRRQKRRFGDTLVPSLVWARIPPLHAAMSVFYAALERRGSPLRPGLRSLVQIRISQINQCAFCIDLNAALAAERAQSLDKALAVAEWRDSAAFDAQERAALEYAEIVTTTGASVAPALMAELKRLFGEKGVIELTALIAFQNLSSKFNAALDIPSQGFCRVPDAKR